MDDVDFEGLFDIDLYESNGILYFNELNLRLGAFGNAARCGSINMPRMLVQFLLYGTKPEYEPRMSQPISCINDKVNFDDYASGYITWDEYLNNRRNAEYSFMQPMICSMLVI